MWMRYRAKRFSNSANVLWHWVSPLQDIYLYSLPLRLSPERLSLSDPFRPITGFPLRSSSNSCTTVKFFEYDKWFGPLIGGSISQLWSLNEVMRSNESGSGPDLRTCYVTRLKSKNVETSFVLSQIPFPFIFIVFLLTFFERKPYLPSSHYKKYLFSPFLNPTLFPLLSSPSFVQCSLSLFPLCWVNLLHLISYHISLTQPSALTALLFNQIFFSILASLQLNTQLF